MVSHPDLPKLSDTTSDDAREDYLQHQARLHDIKVEDRRIIFNLVAMLALFGLSALYATYLALQSDAFEAKDLRFATVFSRALAVQLNIMAVITLAVTVISFWRLPTRYKRMPNSLEVYHYTELGINNIYLLGVDITDDGIKIPKINKLHQLVAEMIIRGSTPITGRHLKFLRIQADMSTTELALAIEESGLRDIYKGYIPGDLGLLISSSENEWPEMLIPFYLALGVLKVISPKITKYYRGSYPDKKFDYGGLAISKVDLYLKYHPINGWSVAKEVINYTQ